MYYRGYYRGPYAAGLYGSGYCAGAGYPYSYARYGGYGLGYGGYGLGYGGYGLGYGGYGGYGPYGYGGY